MKKVYLGDGAYAEHINGMIKVTTSDGMHDTNTIYLEPAVWRALREFAQDIGMEPKHG